MHPHFSRVVIWWLLLLSPVFCVAQQNVPPRPGALKPTEEMAAPAGKNSVATEAANRFDRKMFLVGKESELFFGANLSTKQKVQLQQNLAKLSCVPSDTVVPLDLRILAQMKPPSPRTDLGRSFRADECLSSTFDVKHLVAFRAHLVGHLKQLGQDVEAFERNVPVNCPLEELRYYLNVLSRF